MEAIHDLIWQMAGVILFCAALTLLFVLYQQTQKYMTYSKENINQQHVIWEMDRW